MPREIIGTGKGWGAAKGKKTVKSQPKYSEVLPAGFKAPTSKGTNPKMKVAMKGKKANSKKSASKMSY